MLNLGSTLNIFFKDILSNYRIVIQELRIPFLVVVIAPIVEEIVKFLGYIVLYLFGVRTIKALGYDSKQKFRNDYFIIAFFISAGGFGLIEGIFHNAEFGVLCFYAFIILNMLIHITFSIYPYFLGRKYNNWFFLFLPLGMIFHSFHNFIIDNIWDNKWVTFAMITFLLLPIIILERKSFYIIFERFLFKEFKNSKKANLFIAIVFILLYIYIFLCVWLRFIG